MYIFLCKLCANFVIMCLMFFFHFISFLRITKLLLKFMNIFLNLWTLFSNVNFLPNPWTRSAFKNFLQTPRFPQIREHLFSKLINFFQILKHFFQHPWFFFYSWYFSFCEHFANPRTSFQIHEIFSKSMKSFQNSWFLDIKRCGKKFGHLLFVSSLFLQIFIGQNPRFKTSMFY